jgi:hypothetical protein
MGIIKRKPLRIKLKDVKRIKRITCDHYGIIHGSFGVSWMDTDYFECPKCGLYCQDTGKTAKLYYKIEKKMFNNELFYRYKRAGQLGEIHKWND